MGWRFRVASLVILVHLVLAGCSGPEDPQRATPTPTTAAVAPSPTLPWSTPTPAPTLLPATPTPIAPPVPTATVELTPRPSPTPTATPFIPPPTPVSTEAVITIRRVDTSELIAALTFDAGADRGFAEQILDTLAREGIKATFGMTGRWAEENPDLILRMVNEGHQLINHTYSHASFTGRSTRQPPLSHDQRLGELRATEQVIASVVDAELRPYFRPPYGDHDETVLEDIAAAGYTVNVLWSIDSLGWRGLSAQEIAARCVDDIEPGAIILMHVGAQSQDAHALPNVIRRLQADGYRFVTIAEMVDR